MAWHVFAPFTSSNVAAVRFDRDRSLLEVQFHNGSRYHYFDVPEYVAEAFERAESKGKFLAASIKGHFRYSKV